MIANGSTMPVAAGPSPQQLLNGTDELFMHRVGRQSAFGERPALSPIAWLRYNDPGTGSAFGTDNGAFKRQV
jgi:hypothetical protein